MPEQKGWAGLEPETPKPLSDLKQKKRRPGVFSFKVAGNWPKRAGWRPQSASHSDFFLGRDSTAQLFWPYFYLGRETWPCDHAHRLRLEKLLCLELSRSFNGHFKPLLNPGGSSTSENTTRQFQKRNGRYETVSAVERSKICNGHM